MVKNIHGGNKSKSKARITIASAFRPASNEDEANPCEIYAVITKLYGGGRCDVKCIDDITRTCIIRSRFNRERSSIHVGTWVLVGKRSFETRTNVCDLLEVYSDADVQKLLEMKGNWKVLTNEKDVPDDNIDFTEQTSSVTSAPCVIEFGHIDFNDI
jgi:initiation factor 1A